MLTAGERLIALVFELDRVHNCYCATITTSDWISFEEFDFSNTHRNLWDALRLFLDATELDVSVSEFRFLKTDNSQVVNYAVYSLEG